MLGTRWPLGAAEPTAGDGAAPTPRGDRAADARLGARRTMTPGVHLSRPRCGARRAAGCGGDRPGATSPRRPEGRGPAAVLGRRRGGRPGADRDDAQRRRGDLPLRRLQERGARGRLRGAHLRPDGPDLRGQGARPRRAADAKPAGARHHRARSRRHAPSISPPGRRTSPSASDRAGRLAPRADGAAAGRGRQRPRRAAARRAIRWSTSRSCAARATPSCAPAAFAPRATSCASPSARSASGCGWRSGWAPRDCAGRRASSPGSPAGSSPRR